MKIRHKPAASRLFPAFDIVPCIIITFAIVFPPKTTAESVKRLRQNLKAMCAYGCTVISVGKARVVGTVADQNAAFFQPCGKSFRSLKEQIICTGIPYGKTCFFQFCFHPGAFFSDQFPCFFDVSIPSFG